MIFSSLWHNLKSLRKDLIHEYILAMEQNTMAKIFCVILAYIYN